MSYAKVVWIDEDGLRHAAGRETELGQAVINACDQETSAALGNHGTCVNFCDEVHSTEARLYLWKGNCLRALHRLDDAEHTIAARLLADERSSHQASVNAATQASPPTVARIDEPGELSGIGCPQCYNFIPWDGAVETIRCQCGCVLHAADLARRLLTAYSAPSLRNPIGILAHDLIRHTAQDAWGDAIRVGRLDWLRLGLPLTDAEFATVVARGDGVQLNSCSRLFQGFESRDKLAETAATVARRIQSENDAICRELLYRIAAAPQMVHESLLPALLVASEREEIETIPWDCCQRAIQQKQGG